MNNTPSTQVTDEIIDKFFQTSGFPSDSLRGVITKWESFKSSHASSVGEKRDWEIVSVINPNGSVSEDWCVINNFITGDKRYLGYSINSVRRLSDGEIFSIRDYVVHESSGKDAGIINHIEICGGYPDWIKVHFVGEYEGESNYQFYNHLSVLKKAPIQEPQKLFTTEDGKDIFEGDEYWCEQSPWFISKCTTKDYNPTYDKKRFGTEQAANEYVLMNRPILSVNDVLGCNDYKAYEGIYQLNQCSLKELAKSKINHTGGTK